MSTQPFVGTPNQQERYKHDVDTYKQLSKAIYGGLRVAIPGIVAAFDADTQTVTVDVSIRDKIISNGVIKDAQIPTLLDVPLVLPRSGGYTMTFPVQAGDECLVIFADMCINSWWQNGGIQNQETIRRHDLSDGFAILGTWSQPNKLTNYSTTSVQLRSNDGLTLIDVANNEVTVKATTVNIQGNLNVTGVVTANDVVVTADNIHLSSHLHDDGTGGTTGPPVQGT